MVVIHRLKKKKKERKKPKSFEDVSQDIAKDANTPTASRILVIMTSPGPS
jgi:hypothetical protein